MLTFPGASPFNTLKARGIGIPDLVTCDAHKGLKAALRATLPSTPWQRCQFHLQQNAQADVPQIAMRPSVAADIRSILNSQDLAHAEERLAQLVAKYEKTAPSLSAWMETAIPQGLTVMLLAESLRKRLRTSNMCENLNPQLTKTQPFETRLQIHPENFYRKKVARPKEATNRCRQFGPAPLALLSDLKCGLDHGLSARSCFGWSAMRSFTRMRWLRPVLGIRPQDSRGFAPGTGRLRIRCRRPLAC
ncbi:MAG: transposase [Akkermansiaceae bacterium]|nr:transposase [Akkermansiaceae bacterium]MCF7731052.1 transposase [Akkermansiaceae bacterium]